MTTTTDSNLELALSACADLTASGRNITTDAVKFHIPGGIPLPDAARGVLAWRKMPDEEKQKLVKERQRHNGGNNETASVADPAASAVRDNIRTMSDEAFLKMSPDDRMLYLKRLLEEILREKRRSDF
ncbi:hypothetical protein [Succinimonas sp.]|uniref:hypothetical protein n=1 Tax=Succinimonas sp. TaxID=1936151 RepID=UPI003870CDA1